jgi:hypothetical protein
MESKSKMLTKVTGALYTQEEDAILTWTKDLRNLNHAGGEVGNKTDFVSDARA